MKGLLTILSIFFTVSGFGQANQQPIYEEITGVFGTFNTWTFLPQHYNPANKYPFLFFVVGAGEIRTGTRSTDSTRMRGNGPGRAILRSTWDGKGLVRNADGSTVDTTFIVCVMQPPSNQTARSNGSRVADSVIKRYSVDTMRKAFTGLSMGGQMGNQMCMIYSNGTSPTISWEHYTSWSGFFDFSTPFPTSGGTVSNLRFYLDKGGFYYNGAGADDPNVVIEPDDLDSLKTAYPGQVFSFLYPGEAHNSWNNRYERASFYDTIFLRDKYPKAVAPATASTSSSSISISAESLGYGPEGVWTRISGPNTPTITPTGVKSNINITGMNPGTHVFRLRVTNGYGLSSSYWDHTLTVTVTGDEPPGVDSKVITTRKKGQKVLIKAPTVPPPVDTIVAQVFFSRSAQSESGWVNIQATPGPHNAVITGSDSRTWRTIGFSTISTDRWTKSASNFSAAATNFGETTANPTFYFPAKTINSCFYSQNTQSAGNYMLEISNLEQGGVKYRFEIMASADNSGVTESTRECYYILTDKNGDDQSASYNVKQNTANYVLYENKEADSNGKIFLICNPTAGVTGSIYGFISAMRIIKQAH